MVGILREISRREADLLIVASHSDGDTQELQGVVRGLKLAYQLLNPMPPRVEVATAIDPEKKEENA